MSAFIKRFFTPARKAWVSALIAAVGSLVLQLITSDSRTYVSALVSLGMAVVAFALTYQVPNGPPAATLPPIIEGGQ